MSSKLRSGIDVSGIAFHRSRNLHRQLQRLHPGYRGSVAVFGSLILMTAYLILLTFMVRFLRTM